ncbi:hypothetical protein [Bacillus sp. 1NLA3E]|uniref:hypothetical protein n=1 Tax=Bacillus sp. 1NLA3E TaxID=666686 RepID=UPI0002E9DA7D|nr:hypothetical protein [Bacillus sp. 1NLA3E]
MGEKVMKINWKKIYLYIIGIILAVCGAAQALDRNYLALFPLSCSIIFFVKGWGMKNL